MAQVPLVRVDVPVLPVVPAHHPVAANVRNALVLPAVLLHVVKSVRR